jgi:hypothetical protein
MPVTMITHAPMPHFFTFTMFTVDRRPNHALQRTRRERRGCNRCVPCAGSLSLVR